VSAFYSATQVCQPSIQIKPLPVQSLSSKQGEVNALEGRRGKAYSSIDEWFSIEKINSCAFSYVRLRRFRLLVLYTGVSEILPTRLVITSFLAMNTAFI